MNDTIINSFDSWTSAQAIKSNGRVVSVDNQKPYGVNKLRELILELAVRGKLVPQDSNDETASVLLREIAKEKERLVKEGKIKVKDTLPKINNNETPFKIPLSWQWVYISEIGQIIGGGTPQSNNAEYWSDNGISWITPADLYGLKGKYISQGKRDISKTGLKNSSATLLPIGSVLFSSRAPIGYVAISKNSLATNQGFKSCVPYVEGMSEYIYYFLKQSAKEIDAKASGTTFKEISGAGVSKILFPLPPLKEQQRIVAKIDELMALCDLLEGQQTCSNSAHQKLVEVLLGTLASSKSQTEFEEAWGRIANHFDSLFTTEYSIDQLKQTVLQLAVMGKLVPQNPTDEPASELLKRIAKEKEKLVKEGKIKKQESLPDIGEDEKPFELPKEWKWARLQEIIFLLGDGLHGTPVYTPGTKYFFVNGNNLSNGKIEIKQDTKTVSKEEMLKYKKDLSANSVLVSINGTIGNVAFYNGEEIMLGKSACYFNLPDNISKLYIKLLIESEYFMQYALRNTTGTTIRNLGLKAMREFPVPLPSLNEQHRIVSKVDELFALCDALKARIKDAQATQVQLADAVVEGVLG